MVRLSWLLPCLLLLWCGAATAATFTASVDRKALYANEHVVLTLALHNSETRLRAEGVSPNIDLTVLADDFELGIPRADYRFNIDRARGRSTSSITVELFPRRSGRLAIPEFTIDDQTTAPIEIEVHALADDAVEEVFARSGVVNDRLHPRQQTLVWLDLYHRVSLDSARLGGPIETRPERIELHLLPQESRTESIDGIEYQVTRSAWAVSPLTQEAITVYLPDVWVETRAGRQWRLPFGEETITVDGLPAGVDPGTLIGQPSLTLNDPGPARVGDVTPWEITLASMTAMNALPAELPFGVHDGDLKIYMDPPQRRVEIGPDGEVLSVAVYRGTIMPLAPGTFALPMIELPWFDPDSGRIETLTATGPMLEVSPGAPAAVSSITAPELAADGVDDPAHPWRIVSLVLALLWLSTAGLWWWSRMTPGTDRSRRAASAIGGDHAARDRLLAAFGTRTLEAGLNTFEQHFGIDQELRATVRMVQRDCYHPGSDPAGSHDLAARVEQAVRKLREQPLPDGSNEKDPWSPAAFAPGQRR